MSEDLGLKKAQSIRQAKIARSCSKPHFYMGVRLRQRRRFILFFLPTSHDLRRLNRCKHANRRSKAPPSRTRVFQPKQFRTGMTLPYGLKYLVTCFILGKEDGKQCTNEEGNRRSTALMLALALRLVDKVR